MRKSSPGLRSGHFSGNAPIVIVRQERSDAIYRIFNSGRNAFEVTITGDATPVSERTVAKRNSIDVEAKDIISITGGTDIEGSYDYLDGGLGIRTGRFTREQTAAFAIVIGKSPANRIYRVFNSGDRAFTLKPGGALNPRSVQVDCSVDVAIGNKVLIEATSNDRIKGIYEIVEQDNTLRSGRFTFEAANTTSQHPVIGIQGHADGVWYRVFNSGKKNFFVEKGSPAVSSVELLQRQSFDFLVEDNTEVHIRAAATGRIEGIYEFLGIGT